MNSRCYRFLFFVCISCFTLSCGLLVSDEHKLDELGLQSLDSSEVSKLYVKAYHLTNSLLENQGDWGMAIAAWHKVVRLDSSYRHTMYNRSLCYWMNNDSLEAIRDLSAAIILRPNESDYWNNRGSMYLEMGDTLNACKDYQKAEDLGQYFSAEDRLCD